MKKVFFVLLATHPLHTFGAGENAAHTGSMIVKSGVKNFIFEI